MATTKVNLPTKTYPTRTFTGRTHEGGWPGGGGGGGEGGIDEAAHDAIGAPRHGFIVSDTDPGAVGAGVVWSEAGNLRLRNDTDTDWLDIFAYLGGDGTVSFNAGSATSGYLTFNPDGTVELSAGSGSIQFTAAGGIKFVGLPTADPTEADQLWNDSGTLKVSAG